MNKLTYAKRVCGVFLGLAILALWAIPASASDWPRFHGPDGNGISPDTQPVPLKWSDTENLKWKCKLPGPGSSSPIVVGQRVFVTCWTGYGVDPDTPTWGNALANSQGTIPNGDWWWPVFPGVAIVLTVLGINFMGDGLRDALDPKSRL